MATLRKQATRGRPKGTTPDMEMTAFLLHSKEKKALARIAKRDDITLSQLLRKSVKDFLDRQ